MAGSIIIVGLIGMVILHEFGHYITARLTGMKVTEFFFGFGPRIWSTRRGETEYGVKAIPAGGYVRIAGMNPFEEVTESDTSRVYGGKKYWQKALVVSAGSLTHLLAAFILLVVVFAQSGRATTTIAEVVGTVGDQESPAAAAGIVADDTVVAINGEPVDAWEDLTAAAQSGETFDLTLERGGQTRTVTVTPVVADGRPVIGVVTALERENVVAAIGDAAVSVPELVWYSIRSVATVFSPSSLWNLFTAAFAGAEPPPDDQRPSSAVGIFNASGQIADQSGLVGVLYLLAVINIFVGIFNLLPVFPLDGGHLAVATYERLTRRKVDVRKLIPIGAAVVLILGAVFLATLVLDITDPIEVG